MLGILLRWIDPCIHDLQNEEIIALHQTRISDPTFKIAEAFLDQGRADLTGRKRRQFRSL